MYYTDMQGIEEYPLNGRLVCVYSTCTCAAKKYSIDRDRAIRIISDMYPGCPAEVLHSKLVAHWVRINGFQGANNLRYDVNDCTVVAHGPVSDISLAIEVKSKDEYIAHMLHNTVRAFIDPDEALRFWSTQGIGYKSVAYPDTVGTDIIPLKYRAAVLRQLGVGSVKGGHNPASAGVALYFNVVNVDRYESFVKAAAWLISYHPEVTDDIDTIEKGIVIHDFPLTVSFSTGDTTVGFAVVHEILSSKDTNVPNTAFNGGLLSEVSQVWESEEYRSGFVIRTLTTGCYCGIFKMLRDIDEYQSGYLGFIRTPAFTDDRINALVEGFAKHDIPITKDTEIQYKIVTDDVLYFKLKSGDNVYVVGAI